MLATAVILGPLLSAGCGGGSSSSPFTPRPTATPTGGSTATPTPTPTPTAAAPVQVTAKVLWAARSRQEPATNQVAGPSSALSASFTLTGANSGGGGDITFAGDRDPKFGSGGQQTFSSAPQTARPGIYPLLVRFYANNGQQGALVGTAAASATVQADGSIATVISTSTTITAVDVAPNQTLAVGETKTLSFTQGNNVFIYSPKDKDGNIVAVTPGSATLVLVKSDSTVPGQASAAVQGDSITGLNPQRATVRVTIDYKESPETAILVRSNAVITATPANADISLLESQTFTATVQNDNPTVSGVIWSVLQGDTAGTIDANGVFKATRLEGTFTVRATSKYDPNVFTDLPVTVGSKVVVAITPSAPAPVSIGGGQQKFDATVARVPAGEDAGVTWSVQESNGGSITADGLYTAPATPGDYTIVATSKFDERKSASVKVKVQSNVGIAITPNNPTISIKDKVNFQANVTGVPVGGDTGVTWSIAETGSDFGSIDPNSGAYTAPAKPTTLTIVATSKFFPLTKATVTVTVVSNIKVTVPSATATMSIKDKRTFQATVTGGPTGFDASVTWAIKNDNGKQGTINPNTGEYSSPASPAVVTLQAFSKFDPSAAPAEIVVTVDSFVTVTITPDSLPVPLSLKGVQAFVATVANVPTGGDTGVIWTREPGAGVPAGTDIGTINANGVYTAPPIVPLKEGITIRVTATSKFDPTRKATVEFLVKSNVAVTVLPDNKPTRLPIGAQRQFTANVTGVPTGGDTGVTWSKVRGVGNITSGGVYLAPGVKGTATIQATSKYDPNAVYTVDISVESGDVDIKVN